MFEVYPARLIALPDTSVIMAASSTYFIREIGLNPKVLMYDGRDDQEVNLIVRVFRKSKHVVWARAFTRYDSTASLALMSPSTLAVTSFPSPSFPGHADEALSICFVNVRNGALKYCKSDKNKPEFLNISPLLIAAGPNNLLIPSTSFESALQAYVSIFDVNTGRYTQHVPLGSAGEEHAEDFQLYGAVTEGTACFLTKKQGPPNPNRRGVDTYELLVRCFDLPWNNNGTIRKRVRSFGMVPSFETPRFAKVAAGRGQVFVTYEINSALYVHKLDVKTLESLNWFNTRRSSTMFFPRIIRAPATRFPASTFAGNTKYLKRRNGLAVLVESAANITGKFSVRASGSIVLAGTGTYQAKRPQKWMIYLGKKRVPIVEPVPIVENSVGGNPFPEPYGQMLQTDLDVSTSGRKAIIFGMLETRGYGDPTGPLFSYDLEIPYRQM